MKKFEGLYKNEIKKINKAGNGKIGEYFATCSTIEGFHQVICSVFDVNFEKVVATVYMNICLFDRRKSFVWKVVAA